MIAIVDDRGLARRDGASLGPLLARHLQNKRDIVMAALRGTGPADPADMNTDAAP